MADDSAQGQLSVEDIEDLWIASVDPSYSGPFQDADAARVAGNPAAIGFVPYEQAFAQLARVSQAIDVSTQASYILPWSGQTNPPAQGEQKATVTLVFSRALRPDVPLRIGAGLVFIEEQTTDWGSGAGITVRTGRRYTLTQDLVFMPGDVGPFNVSAIAENVGWGYNNPLHDTIRFIDQPGSGFTHVRATVTFTAGTPAPPAVPTNFEVVTLITVNEADTFIPEHVGQYVSFLAGANAGKIARIVSFVGPNAAAVPPVGSTVTLEPLGVFESFTVLVAGTFGAGEMIVFDNGTTPVAYGSFVSIETLANGHRRIAYVLLSGAVATATKVVGLTSGASYSVDVQLLNPMFVAEAPPSGGLPGGASWVVLDWVNDLGLSVTNPASPAGGRLGMLDAIGFERKIPRSPGETDDAYRQRIWQIADVVTPNAIRRTLNRIGPGPWCLREVGSALLPGFFYDRTDPGGDAWDYDVLQFKALVGTPPFAPSLFQEPIQILDPSGRVKASGYLGRADPSGLITMIRKSGEGTVRHPLVLTGTSDTLHGLVGGWSGAIDGTQPYNAVGLPQNLRFHYYLDYEQFRGFFLIGVPRRATGEFGNAYDIGADNAYDLPAPHRTFYDGSAFSAADAQFYKQVYQAVDRVRAGGVGFDLYIEDGTCT